MNSAQWIVDLVTYITQHGNAVDMLGLVMSTVGSALTAVMGFGVKFLRDLAKNVKSLDSTIAILVLRANDHEEEIKDHEQRLRWVEKKVSFHKPGADE